MGYPPSPMGAPAQPYPGQFGQPLEKPTAAMVLSIIGGIFILLWGAFLTWVGVEAQSLSFGVYGGGLTLIGGIEDICGLLIVVFGVLLYVSPEHHVPYGVLVLVLSVVSLVGLGGLIIGFILALIGGILGIVHKPTPAAPQVVFVQPQRICPKCGRPQGNDVRFCSACGNPLA